MSNETAEKSEPTDATQELAIAARYAMIHVQELREAWRTGAISEHDGKGGTRSNRNVDVERRLANALNSWARSDASKSDRCN
jgi:hypothetical protein